MVRKTATAENEPEESNYEHPSEGEHLFQVVDILENISTDPDIVHAKLEVVGGGEEGRSILNRCCLDDSSKAFYFTRMFLKVLGCEYKGTDFPIDSDEWIGRQAYGRVEHDGKYANVVEWNFDKIVEKAVSELQKDTGHKEPEEVAWDES